LYFSWWEDAKSVWSRLWRHDDIQVYLISEFLRSWPRYCDHWLGFQELGRDCQ
jgi:hypothetical protein